MNRTLTLVAATAAAALTSYSAYAGCADPRTQGAFRQMPPISLPLSSGINRARSGDATTNIVGTWLVSRAAVPHLRASGDGVRPVGRR